MTHPSTLRWYAALGQAISGPEADPQGVLLALLDSVGRRLGEVDDVVRDTAAGPGWSGLLDVDRTPAVGWLGQLVGVTLPGGLSDLDQRALVRDRPATRRGTVPALVAAARATLNVPDGYVEVVERDGSPYRLTVRTYDTQTLSPTATNAALQAAKPAGLVLVHEAITMTSYSALEAEAPETYTALEATAAQTYTALEG